MPRLSAIPFVAVLYFLAASGRAQIVDVTIHHFAFEPNELTIEVGTTVRWSNMDGTEHTATSQTGPGTLTPSGLFDSGLLGPGDVFEYTFAAPGPIYYFCIPHGSSMQGTITVLLPPCPGDLDGNRLVGLADLTTLLANFGMPGGATPDDGDLDGDADIDLTDLTSFLSVFGIAC